MRFGLQAQSCWRYQAECESAQRRQSRLRLSVTGGETRNTAFNPPKANELESAHSMLTARAVLGTASSTQSGSASGEVSGRRDYAVVRSHQRRGRFQRSRSTKACPCMDLVELTGNLSA